MRSQTTLASMVLVGLALGGCALENPDHVMDTTGAETGWACGAGACTTLRETFSDPVPACDGEDVELLVGAGALALLCAVGVGPDGQDIVHALTCRPLACADGLDCPQWGGREYTCVEELCQVANVGAWRLDRVDLTALCLYDVPRHASCAEAEADPAVAARLAGLDAVCDDDGCDAIPAGCLAP